MSLKETEKFLRSATPGELLAAYGEASPKRGGMTRVFNDGYVMGTEGISEPFVNDQMPRVPIIFGTNRYETKLFNMMNPRFVKWGEGEGIFSWIGVDELPLEIMRPDFYNAVNQYSSDSWKERAADTPARQLVASGYKKAFVYRFDWDDLPVIQGVDYGILAGAAHALEILFLFPAAFDNFIIKNVVIRDSYDGAKKLSNQMLSYWAQFAYTGDPGKGRSNDLPQWKAWSDEEKYLILDSDEDQGLVMVDNEVTVNSIYNELTNDQRFTQEEKCQSLFAMSYSGDEFPIELFDSYSDGYCLTLDYSDILETMNPTLGEDGDEDS
jgi:para-nitrobenzyl esterase